MASPCLLPRWLPHIFFFQVSFQVASPYLLFPGVFPCLFSGGFPCLLPIWLSLPPSQVVSLCPLPRWLLSRWISPALFQGVFLCLFRWHSLTLFLDGFPLPSSGWSPDRQRWLSLSFFPDGFPYLLNRWFPLPSIQVFSPCLLPILLPLPLSHVASLCPLQRWLLSKEISYALFPGVFPCLLPNWLRSAFFPDGFHPPSSQVAFPIPSSQMACPAIFCTRLPPAFFPVASPFLLRRRWFLFRWLSPTFFPGGFPLPSFQMASPCLLPRWLPLAFFPNGPSLVFFPDGFPMPSFQMTSRCFLPQMASF